MSYRPRKGGGDTSPRRRSSVSLEEDPRKPWGKERSVKGKREARSCHARGHFIAMDQIGQKRKLNDERTKGNGSPKAGKKKSEWGERQRF